MKQEDRLITEQEA